MISDLTLAALKAEVLAQDAKWGEQNHDPEIWLAILAEEVGELAQAMLADRFDAGRAKKMHDSHHDAMEIEAIQIAAVACQFVEFLARRKVNRKPSQLEQVRAVLYEFDWEYGDRQYALEKISTILDTAGTL